MYLGSSEWISLSTELKMSAFILILARIRLRVRLRMLALTLIPELLDVDGVTPTR